jgi:thiamine biosynthesis lipoprotein
MEHMAMNNPSRRRFLAVSAMAAALAPLGARAGLPAETVRWHGRAMGADAEIVLEHPDGRVARNALADALTEIERLEAIFSLHRPQSAVARLNAAGFLAEPPLDLVRALQEAATISAASNGAFDVTIQPVWRLHAEWLRTHRKPPQGAALAAAARLVDWRSLDIAPDRIAFRRDGMAVTLNGLAQGYITDRVAELLRRRGFDNVLVDLGETRVLGPHADGQPWRVSVRDPINRDRSLGQLALTTGAVATTEALGSSFAAHGAFGHLVDPVTGKPALAVPSVTIQAPTATLADGLSTAIAVAGAAKAGAILAQFPGTAMLPFA